MELAGELAKYGEIGVIIGCLAIIAFILKAFFDYLNNANKKLNEAVRDNTKTISHNTEVQKEISRYLKMRNGSIEKAIQINRQQDEINTKQNEMILNKLEELCDDK